MNSVIKVEHLCKKFGKQNVIKNLTFEAPAGAVFAFLGPNGAGKTTTIKTLMNIYPPSGGKAYVLGKDSQHLSEPEFQKIGYVSENQKLPQWMTVKYFLSYCRTMYPSWDQNFCEQLVKQFDIPPDRKIKDLSRGMKMKVALISSLSYRPNLLILDEPFSGLDPLVRQELISGILEMTNAQSWTIFLSSHDLDEVERLADYIAVIDKGEIKLSEGIDSLLSRFKEIVIELGLNELTHKNLPGHWMFFEHQENQARFICSQFHESLEAEVKQIFPESKILQVRNMTLKEIFLALIRHFKIDNF